MNVCNNTNNSNNSKTNFFFFSFPPCSFLTEKATSKSMTVFEDVAEEMKGKATLAYVNCG